MQKAVSPYLPSGIGGHLVAMLAGFLVTLSMAPYKLWPATIAAMALYQLALFRLTPKQAFWRGWFFGFGAYITGASWVYVSIHEHGNAAPLLAGSLTTLFCAGLALFFALPSYLYVRFFHHKPLYWLSFAGIFVLNEWFRCWFLTGFPWLLLGTSQVDGPLAGWAPLIGTLGISAIMALSGATLTAYLLNPSRGKQILLIALVALWVMGPSLNRVEWVQEKTGATLTASLVQANIPQADKWDPSILEPTYALYRQLSEPLWQSDMVVWPETAVPRFYHRALPFLNTMSAKAEAHGSTLVTGIPFVERDKDNRAMIYNTVIAMGSGHGIYHKRQMVPFGEYVPLEGLLRGLIDFFDLPMSNFTRGPSEQSYLTIKGLKIAPFICYEVVYPELVREALPEADILLTISNDTWFGESIGPIQHFELARMRALENGRPLIRGTNNGITAFIDHKGQVQQQAKHYVQTTLTGTVQAMTGLTPFARFGQWPILGLAFAWLAGILLYRRLRTTQA